MTPIYSWRTEAKLSFTSSLACLSNGSSPIYKSRIDLHRTLLWILPTSFPSTAKISHLEIISNLNLLSKKSKKPAKGILKLVQYMWPTQNKHFAANQNREWDCKIIMCCNLLWRKWYMNEKGDLTGCSKYIARFPWQVYYRSLWYFNFIFELRSEPTIKLTISLI